MEFFQKLDGTSFWEPRDSSENKDAGLTNLLQFRWETSGTSWMVLPLCPTYYRYRFEIKDIRLEEELQQEQEQEQEPENPLLLFKSKREEDGWNITLPKLVFSRTSEEDSAVQVHEEEEKTDTRPRCRYITFHVSNFGLPWNAYETCPGHPCVAPANERCDGYCERHYDQLFPEIYDLFAKVMQ